MPHDEPLDLIREHPDLAVDLVRGYSGIKLPRKTTTSLASTDMSAVVPVQYLADSVVLILNAATKKPVLAVVIEPQLRDRETKRYSWPVYVTTARRVNKCPRAVLMVICPDLDEAKKCRRTIQTGHPGFDLTPIVIDSSNPPGVNGNDGDPHLTVFAAAMGGIDMTSEQGARNVLDAIAAAADTIPNRRRMQAIILNVASDAARQILEALMRNEYPKTFVDEIYEEGEARGEAKALLRILDARGIALTADQRAQISACTDSAQLDRWLDRVITATSAAEVLAA